MDPNRTTPLNARLAPEIKDGRPSRVGQPWTALALIVLGLGLTALSFWGPAWRDAVVRVSEAAKFVIIPIRAIALAPAGVVVSIFGWIRVRRCRDQNGCSSWDNWLYGLAPLSLVPLILVLPLVGFLLPKDVVATVIFYGPVSLLAWSLTRLYSRFETRDANASIGTWVVGSFILFFSLFYAGVGTYYTASIGEHAGDEGHYLVQMRSLGQDGDLDIRNNLGFPSSKTRSRNHVSKRSSNGHWYSWHPFGLSLLLAPAANAGLFLRHLVLGIISGLGVGGILVLCRYFRARWLPSILFTLLFSLSLFWGVYSVRALPEVLGAALAIWLVAAAFMQEEHPYWSLLVAAVCASYLPWAHTRFVPVSLLGLGWYVLAAWRGGAPWGPRIFRVLALVLLCAGGYAAYLAVQRQMFSGGMSYAVRDLILSRPIGIWHALASDRGVLYSLPMFAWMFPAVIWLAVRDGERRWPALMALSYTVVILVTSSATVYTGGTCLPGRHLLVAVPLLVAPAAVMFDRLNPWGRIWVILLGLASCMFFLLDTVFLPRMFKGFIFPVEFIRIAWAVLAGLPQPLTDPYAQSLHLFGLWMYVVSIVMTVPGIRWSRLRAAILVATAVLLVTGGRVTRDISEREVIPWVNADLLARAPVRGMQFVVGETPPPRPLLDVSNRFAGRGSRNPLVPYVATRGSGGNTPRGAIFQSTLKINDWAGRPLRWVELVRPFMEREGERLIWLTGRVDGSARVVLAIREADRTICSVPLTPDADNNISFAGRFECLGTGEISILTHLEGEGGFRPTAIGWTPINDNWLRLCRLALPEDVRTH